MKIPGSEEFVREALLIVGGTIVAALIVSKFPDLRAWIARQWQPPGCNCDKP